MNASALPAGVLLMGGLPGAAVPGPVVARAPAFAVVVPGLLVFAAVAVERR
ncbi:hypothetical protein FHX81_0491 [Saccharothrix saharensis]|uniref:Uncharacterized protein n=1 Tax=Saccharothrix saharensis TaxID=571190 RepID=A0A543J5X8_9PSEU|nr:hypothetical protein [Saccharothrix saharensis]TQM78231.1 hypothetical protein FHX81_0491 [Saccharothrix saharensis]